MNRKNNRRLLIITLISILIPSLGFNLFQWKEKQSYIERIIKKDKAITEIRNTIKIITKAPNSIDAIQGALKKDFNVASEIMYSEIDSSFSFVVTPKDWNQIDYQGIWTFYGLQIVFDKQKKFQQIDFYKP
ncbi:hypothetical protein [Aquimarina rubra]|uniref:DUF4359 domain-containing protein n=1 Tax=Aquimarina rubra TaxID=1920033 RepID=A0ABW5LE98_9FLAO